MDAETLQEALEKAQDRIAELDSALGHFLSKALVHATVLRAKNELDPSKFEKNDLVLFVDGSRDHGRTARIMGGSMGSPAVDDAGYMEVMFPNLRKRKVQVGINGHIPQVKLLGKNDGTAVTISHDGTPYEVFGVFGKKFENGQVVKVNLDSKQIVEDEGMHSAGGIAFIKAIIDEDSIEVEQNGNLRVVLNGCKSSKMEVGDRVGLDRSDTVIVRHMKRLNEDANKVDPTLNVEWSDIGGCEEAKEAMLDLFELPFAYPELFKFYNKKLPKGGLIYGPPGCGKTLLGKAVYTSVCKRHGKGTMASGWIYVKGPEILNMWLGNSEANIRELFRRGEKHYETHGVPAVMFIDEAEAMLGMRGAHRTSNINDTTVPQFLSEMDGLNENHTVVLLATNRPGMIDPAAVRHGRCDRHIKVPRPNQKTASDIFKIHLKGVPFDNTDTETVAKVCSENLFDDKWTLYKLDRKYIFSLKDTVNGAMIASIVEQATNYAIKRDLGNGKKPKGVSLKDFGTAIEAVYRGQRDQNHTFDLEDFCDTHKISKTNVLVDKLRLDD